MTFIEIITEAINDIIIHGYDSRQRIEDWSRKIRDAAQKELIPEWRMKRDIETALGNVYNRLITREGLVKKGISTITIARVKPKLRAELDRRIMASVSLIKFNRVEMIASTLKRFEGWATSIPKGGSKSTDKTEEKTRIKKTLGQMTFVQRRIAIDQGHKLAAAINNITAVDEGAIAVKWNSHWKQAGYNFRAEHKERDNRIYTIKGNWAIEKGFMKAGANGYYEDHEAFGEYEFCRCFGTYIFTLQKLPDDMLTQKGRATLSAKHLKVV